MPVIKVTATYQDGLPVPEASDIQIKTPPDIIFAYELRCPHGNVVSGFVRDSIHVIHHSDFGGLKSPVIYTRRFDGSKPAVVEINFL